MARRRVRPGDGGLPRATRPTQADGAGRGAAGAARAAAGAEGSERRQGRDRRDPRRGRRAGGRAVGRGAVRDVPALRRAPSLEDRGARRPRPSELGGFKEVVLEVRGKDAYARLKHESGVHRVQRVPVTESSGRIHTSTATVAVLPEAEEVEVEIRPEDLQIDVYRSSGPGRTVGEHHRLGGAHHAQADRASRSRARRSARSCRTARRRCGTCAPGCCSARRTRRRPRRRPARRSQVGHGRACREDPHLQLPRRPRHRSPHQAHLAPAAGRAGGRRRARRVRRSARTRPSARSSSRPRSPATADEP